MAGRLIDVAVDERRTGGGGGDGVIEGDVDGADGEEADGGGGWGREYGEREEYLLGRAMTIVQLLLVSTTTSPFGRGWGDGLDGSTTPN